MSTHTQGTSPITRIDTIHRLFNELHRELQAYCREVDADAIHRNDIDRKVDAAHHDFTEATL